MITSLNKFTHIILNIRKKSYEYRCQLKKRLKSQGHNVDNFPPIDHVNPLMKQHSCLLCGDKVFHTETELSEHITSIHNSNINKSKRNQRQTEDK